MTLAADSDAGAPRRASARAPIDVAADLRDRQERVGAFPQETDEDADLQGGPRPRREEEEPAAARPDQRDAAQADDGDDSQSRRCDGGGDPRRASPQDEADGDGDAGEPGEFKPGARAAAKDGPSRRTAADGDGDGGRRRAERRGET